MRALRRRGLRLVGQEPGQRLQRHLPQPLPFGHQPVLEERLVEAEAEEQVAPVELGGVRQPLDGALGHPPLEGRHVDLHLRRIQGKRRPVDEQDRGRGVGQRLAQGGERMAEAVAGVLVAPLPPEQGRQLVA